MKPTILAALLIAFVACATEEPRQASPQWSISGTTVNCPNASDTTSFHSGDYYTFDCIWYCVTYDGQPDQYVDLMFQWTGTEWVLVNEYVSSGICG